MKSTSLLKSMPKPLSRILRRGFYGNVASYFVPIAPYFDRVVEFDPLPHDDGTLRSEIQRRIGKELERGSVLPRSPILLLLNGHLNYSLDIEEMLSRIHGRLSRDARVATVVYNPYLRWIYLLLNGLGLREGPLPTTFVTGRDLKSLALLSRFEILRRTSCGFLPFVPWFERLLGMIPLVRRLGLVEIVWLRPVVPSEHPPSLSVIVPARNERGNIEPLLRRLPEKGPDLEVILVEGNSVDGTWEEILRCVPLFEDRFPIRAVRQEGRGKADAVRLGLSLATRETVAILDADMTVPPEFLPRFLRVYAEGLGDFVNGCRLLYPMEGKAMQFLNRVANLFFAKLLAAVLDIPINDSLCGTKLFSRRDALRFRAWRTAFGDFDPFGDFELLFPASLLLSGVVDLPVRYRARTYGRTNIRRFRDGLVLLRMAMLGFLTVRLGWSRKC